MPIRIMVTLGFGYLDDAHACRLYLIEHRIYSVLVCCGTSWAVETMHGIDEVRDALSASNADWVGMATIG